MGMIYYIITKVFSYKKKIKVSFHDTLIIILYARIKILVNTDISILEFYGYIRSIGIISVDIFTKISVKQKLTKKYFEIHVNTLKMCKNDIKKIHILKTIFIIIYKEIIFQ